VKSVFEEAKSQQNVDKDKLSKILEERMKLPLKISVPVSQLFKQE